MNHSDSYLLMIIFGYCFSKGVTKKYNSLIILGFNGNTLSLQNKHLNKKYEHQ